MRRPLTVRAFGRREQLSDHLAAVASLPKSLRLVHDGLADIALVANDADSIAFGGTAAASLVVAHPAMIGAADSQALAATDKAVFAAFELLSTLRPAMSAESLAGGSLVRSQLCWRGTLQAAVAEHLVALVKVVGPLRELTLLSNTDLAYVGTARTGAGASVLWSGQLSQGESSYMLDVVGRDTRLEVAATLDGSARPLAIRRFTDEGLQSPLGVFETGLRQFWRGVANDLNGVEAAPPWRDHAELLALSHELTGATSVRKDR